MTKKLTRNRKVDHLVEEMTLDEKLLLLHGQLFDKYRANQAGFVHGIERLGIPDIFICDGESGINTSWDATAMPAKVSLAATFDTNAAFDYGKVLGEEAKASGMNVVLSPRVNIARDSVTHKTMSNGGNYQTYSEDPLLNGKMGAAEALGIQYQNNAIANLKQMFGSSTGTAQGAGNVVIDEQTMHEIYMKPFEEVIKAGVGSNMTNYNQVNGIWTYKYTDMTQKLCRDQWGFKGFTVDDWLCLYEPEAIIEGVTLEMPGSDKYGEGSAKSIYGESLRKALLDPENEINIEHIDRAVSYYLCTLDQFGMLGAQRIPGPIDENTKLQSLKVAREIACKGAVLLKNNDHILPIDVPHEKLAIIGCPADQQAMPTFKEAAYGFPDRKIGFAKVLQDHTELPVLYAVGNDLEGKLIPLENLKDADGIPGGVSLDIITSTYDLLSDKTISEPFKSEKSLGRIMRNGFVGEQALPIPEISLTSNKNGSPFDKSDLFYMVHGSICAPETGEYRITMQNSMPTIVEFEKNHIQSEDMAILTSGNLYLKNSENCYACIGEGIRVLMNGGAVANSEVLPCKDGFNNVGGYVFLEAGKEYQFIATACSVYKEPVQLRLCWVTPSMAEAQEKEAIAAAKQADKAIVFVWHKTSDTLRLPGNQDRLIEKVAKANPNTVVVINSGDPIEMPWIESVKGIVEMWYSGQEGALATFDILSGRFNPAGRLPVTFPKKLNDTAPHEPGHPERYSTPGREHTKDFVAKNVAHFTEGINMGYRHFDAKEIEPQFEFGFGLSYTEFEYSDPVIEILNDGGLSVSCRVKNTGSITGDEVVQVYLGRPDVAPKDVQISPKTLAAFTRITLEGGEEKEVNLKIDAQSLCFWNVKTENNRLDEEESWMRLVCKRNVMIGASSRKIKLEQTIEVK